MDLSGVISNFGATITGTRRTTAGYGSDGRLDAPSTSSLSLVAVVEPAGGRDLQRLPEGMRTREVKAVWTATALKSADATYEPDLLTIEGASWEVQNVENWSTHGNYYRALVVKV